MENLFLQLLNLSITASYVILAVILLRFLLFLFRALCVCLDASFIHDIGDNDDKRDNKEDSDNAFPHDF